MSRLGAFLSIYTRSIWAGGTHVFSSSGLGLSTPPAKSSSRLDFVFASIVRLDVRRAVRASALSLKVVMVSHWIPTVISNE